MGRVTCYLSASLQVRDDSRGDTDVASGSNRRKPTSRRLDDSVDELSRGTSRRARSSSTAREAARRASSDASRSGDYRSSSYPYSSSPSRYSTSTSRPSVSAGRAGSRSRSESSASPASHSRSRASAETASRSRDAEGDSAPKKNFYLRHLKVCVTLTAVVVILIGICVFDVAMSWGVVHPGVTVCGVDVGGLSLDDAEEKIDRQLSKRADAAEITLIEGTGDEEDGVDVDEDGEVSEWEITTDTLEAGVDAESAAADAYAVGRSGNLLATRISAWMGDVDVQASITCNSKMLSTLADEVDDAIGISVKNSRAKIEDGTATLKEGSDGWLVDTDELVDRLSQAFFDESLSQVTTPMHDVEMYIKPDTAQNIVDEINERIADSVEIVYGDESWTMDSTELGDVVSQKVLAVGKILQIDNGEVSTAKGDIEDASWDMSAGLDPDSGKALQAYIDPDLLDDYLVSILGDAADGDAVDASFDVSSGEVVIIESQEGEGPDRRAAEDDMQDLVFGDDTSAERKVVIEDGIIEPSLTTEDAEAMGIKEKLASWSIPMSGTSSRQSNIILLADLIDGSITAPGETWSFNETTGERTAEKGFEEAGAYVEGEHVDQVGGGICQVATCVFNAACYSGLGIGTRANHTYYVSAYDDQGFNDATVSWPSPDFQWVNDTDNYILLTATAYTGGSVTVTLWGTDDGRVVECNRGEWKDGESYDTVYEEDDTLEVGVEKVTSEGVDGRSITINYHVESADGEVLHDIDFRSVYAAEDEVIAVGTKEVEEEETEEADSSSTSKKKKQQTDTSDEE